MGYRDYLAQRKTSIWSDNNALLMLIILNVFTFIVLRFILAVYGLSYLRSEDYYQNIFQWFSMPAKLSTFITRPWTLISSNFTQLDIWLLLSNMFWLWTYGYIFQDLTGNRKVIPLYLYGGITGAIVYLISYNVFPQMKVLADSQFYFGATTSIIAIAVGATTFSPGIAYSP
jgi:membrane associated rhomboid family serine protease